MPPYLFIIAEEILSIHIQQLRLQGKIHSISKVHSSPCHLLYVDDILLFVKNSFSNLRSLQDPLSSYQSLAGQMFNLQKSQLFLRRCNHRRKRKISSILRIEESTRHLRYVGIPLVFGTPKKPHFHPLIDSINSKLATWKARTLSFAGSLIMIKHVLSSIPFHSAWILPLPMPTCNVIKRLMRSFL